MKVWSIQASWHTDGVQCQALQNVVMQSRFLAAMSYIKKPPTKPKNTPPLGKNQTKTPNTTKPNVFDKYYFL